MNRNIIITGGLGFIGSNLVETLIKKKYFVVNIDKVNYASNYYNTKKFHNLPNYKFYKFRISLLLERHRLSHLQSLFYQIFWIAKSTIQLQLINIETV